MGAFSSVRRFGCVVALTAGAWLATGGPGLSARQVPRFRASVEVVAIDVSVVDKAGKPIAELGPDEFTVTVDGVPRRIVSAQFIDHHGAPAPPAIPQAAAADNTPSEPPPAPPVRGRDVLIVIDEDSLDTGDGMVARRAATGFLDKLGPKDRVGLTTIPRLRSNLTLSPDHEEARRALANWVPGVGDEVGSTYWIGVSEALEIDAMDPITTQKVIARECQSDSRGRNDSSCGRAVVQEARNLASRIRSRGTRALDALRTLARGLRQVDGPKTIVLVSGGLLPPESNSSFSELDSELAAAQVSLYTLYFEKSPYAVTRTKVSPTLMEDDRIEADGLANVTSAAGGTLLNVIGTVEPYFERVAAELSASYLLGIEVTQTDRDGKPHKVSVKVNRPGVEVRARRQYVIPAEKPPKGT